MHFLTSTTLLLSFNCHEGQFQVTFVLKKKEHFAQIGVVLGWIGNFQCAWGNSREMAKMVWEA
jgi:hypothetical protein